MVMVITNCKKKDEEVSTTDTAPLCSAVSASMVGHGWAILNASVNAKGLSTLVSFEYDTVTTYGKTVKADPDTLTLNASASVSANVTGLEAGKKYHFRVKAVNQAGTTFGSDLSFTTTVKKEGVTVFNPGLTYGSITDIDGNSYKTIQIGTQTWMAENLKTTSLTDGTAVPFILDATTWSKMTTPGYTWYNGDSLAYGAMYNWHAVKTGRLCPDGWHVPTDAEWTVLTSYLGDLSVSGGKLKETGTLHWNTPNNGATNETGFTALPGGYRDYFGIFGSIKRIGYWWSSSEATSSDAWFRGMHFNYINADRSSSNKKSGFSVRCILN